MATATQTTTSVLEVPRGQVTASLGFYAPPADGSRPFNYVETPPAGQPQRNYTSNEVAVPIHDARGIESEFSLDRDAFKIVQNVPDSTERDFVDDDHIKAHYYPEVEQLLLDNVPGSHKVFIFDHTIRRTGGKRGPVNQAHIDQTATAARQRVELHLGAEAPELLKGRFRIINVWRPLNGPLYTAPLAFASSHTVAAEDLVEIDHIYPSRTGSTAGVKYRPSQRWNYLSGITNNERLLLECFDSEGVKEGSGVKGGRVPHSAFNDPRTPEGAPKRESIEVRALVFGP